MMARKSRQPVTAPAPAPVVGASGKARIRFGAWEEGMVQYPSRFINLEVALGRPLDVASYFYGYGDWWPVGIERTFANGGARDILLSMDMGEYRFSTWSRGQHDTYLATLVACAKSYPYPIHVRPWPEMNGDWQNFQPDATGSKPFGGTHQEFITAWRYVVNYFRARGVTNVKWVFNPTTDVYPGTTDVRNIWPGAEYVDVLGLDGYNWGDVGQFGTWADFGNIFSPQYARLVALHPTAPVWVCETGCKEPKLSDGAPLNLSKDKGVWIKNMFADIEANFPRITTVCWFNEKKERDWRLESSPSSLTAIRSTLGAL